MAFFGLFGPPNIEKLRAKRDVQGLIKALGYRKDYYYLIRSKAVYSLGEIKDARAVEPLIGVLNDVDPNVRSAAVKALGQIGDARAVEPLVVELKNWDSDVRKAAAAALQEIDPNWMKSKGAGAAVPSLVAALKGGDANVQSAAAEALGQIKDARAVEPLIAAFKDRDVVWYVQQAAAEALGQIGDARAVEPLVEAIKDKNIGGAVVTTLVIILERAAVDITTETLHSLSRLTGAFLTMVTQDSCAGGLVTTWAGAPPVDCPQVRQLARKELIRRGIAA